MTISSENRKAGPFAGNDVTTVFPFTFKLFDKTQLQVIFTSAASVDSTLVLDIDYSVALNADQDAAPGGNITYPIIGTPLATGTKLTGLSIAPNTQLTDITNGGGFFPQIIEDALDVATILVQQVIEKLNRAIRQPASDSAVIGELPPSTGRALMYLGFDSSGNPIAAAPVTGSLISVPMQPVVAAVSLASARALLGADAAYIAKAIVTTKGDLVGASGNATPVRIPVGADGRVPMARSADASGIAYVAGLNKVIYGLNYAMGDGAGGGDLVNDITIFAGGAMDATAAYFMAGAQLTKQLDVNWAVGNAAGGLDTGAIGNNDYYLWQIARSDTGVVDYLFSLSSTAPTMPASYNFKRLIGWFRRTAGAIVAFHTYEMEGGGLQFTWDTPPTDVSLANTLTTTARLDTLSVPANFSVVALITMILADGAAGTDAVVTCPDMADIAANGGSLAQRSQVAGVAIYIYGPLRTSATGQVRSKSGVATMDSYTIRTNGFTWARRN